jgi:hypothetical protein
MDWLRSVSKDLVTTGCTDAKKVRFAAHLLEGPTTSWWDTYQITHPIDGVTWDSFREGFRAAHISSGVMGLKKKEFHDLRQKYRNMFEYIDEFTNLSHYAPDDIDTDAKRKEKFLEGLNDELSIPLSIAYTPTFQSLLDQAIIESKMKQSENTKRKHHASKYQELVHKRSFHSGGGSSGFHKNGGNHHNNNGGNGHQHHKGNGHRSHNNHNSTRTNGHNNGNNNVPEKRDISQVECYKCHKTGHYVNDCPQKKDEGNKPNPFQKGHVNHINVEEIYDEPDAVYGMFLLNKFSTVVLFDTGASHSFIHFKSICG